MFVIGRGHGQPSGAKEESNFSQVFDNAKENPPYYNLKISTFLLFGGKRKKWNKYEGSEMETVWMENKLWKSCAMKSVSLLPAPTVLFLCDSFIFVLILLIHCARESPQSLKISVKYIFVLKH